MILAHTLGTGGPDLEMTILAGTLAILGIVFFFQRSVKPAVSVGLLIGSIALGAGAFALGGTPATTGSSDASISITSPAPGDTVTAGKKITLEYELRNGRLAESPEDADAGHLHVYIDDQLDSMTIGDEPTVSVPQGEHKISLEYSSPSHASYDPPVVDSVTVSGS